MSSPSPLWYATRGAGMVVLILLSASLVLGVLSINRWGTAGIPRFVSNQLHRNLSLLAVVFLVIHILTAIMDPFAHLGLKDALVPFASGYRPFWMGVGVLSAELMAALAITTMAREAIGYLAWRTIHALAYAAWPLALIHGLGTGSDTRAGWALGITTLCTLAVLLAIGWRLVSGWPESHPVRLVGVGLTSMATVLLIAWTINGPLHPGWAAASGTPSELLPSPSTAASVGP